MTWNTQPAVLELATTSVGHAPVRFHLMSGVPVASKPMIWAERLPAFLPPLYVRVLLSTPDDAAPKE